MNVFKNKSIFVTVTVLAKNNIYVYWHHLNKEPEVFKE